MFSPALKRFSAAAVCGCAIMWLTGCGAVPATRSDPAAATGAISGTVHGGQQPIVGATVSLYAAGIQGYGVATPPLASTTTDGNGAFNFTPSGTDPNTYCPSSDSTTQSEDLYLLVSGGNADPNSSATNSYIGLMAVVGTCPFSNGSPTVTVNEVSTIAGMFALQEFYGLPTGSGSGGLGSFGSASDNQNGLDLATDTAQFLADTATGVSQVTTGAAITITPEIAKINTEANILAACINSDPGTSTACQTLMQSVNGTAPTNTLEAAFYMAANATSTVNGTSKMSTLFGLTSTQPAFQPTLSTAPPDWTLGVTYSSNAIGTTGSYYLSGTQQIVCTGSDIGNLVVLNNVSNTSNSGNSVTQINTINGNVLYQGLFEIAGPSAMALDSERHVWVASYGSSSALGSTVSRSNLFPGSGSPPIDVTVDPGPMALSADGQGNVFALSTSSSGVGTLQEISGDTSSQIATGLATTTASSIAVDANYTIWISSGGPVTGGIVVTQGGVYQFPYLPSTQTYASTPNAETTAGDLTMPEALAVDGYVVWAANYGRSTVSALAGTTSVSGAGFATPGLTSPTSMATDGADDVWMTSSSGTGSVYGISAAGQLLTPTGGFSGHAFSGPKGIAIDLAGNIWVANANAFAGSTTQGYVTEIVGEGAPTQPITAALPSASGATPPSWSVTKNSLAHSITEIYK